ncbi:MAG: ATP-binding protein [Acidobacteria bacterium]|nr:ATP-binding protein [Acidobacteriota bacterium]
MPCALCDDTGWKTIEADGVRRVARCDCWYQRAAEYQLRAAGIPTRYRHCSLSNFETHYDSLRRAVSRARKFIEDYPVPERGLLFWGAYGVGKTHLAVAILRELIATKGAVGYFCEVPALLKNVRATYDAKTTDGEMDVLAPVLRSDLLVLDDLGEERTSEWVQEALAHVINVRYSENRATIITTGLIDSPDSTDPRSFIFKLGGRTRSRLIEMCEWVHMEGTDSREVGPEPTPERIAEWQEKSPTSPKNIERSRKGFPQKTAGQLKAKPRFGGREDKVDLKWPGGRAGS